MQLYVGYNVFLFYSKYQNSNCLEVPHRFSPILFINTCLRIYRVLKLDQHHHGEKHTHDHNIKELYSQSLHPYNYMPLQWGPHAIVHVNTKRHGEVFLQYQLHYPCLNIKHLWFFTPIDRFDKKVSNYIIFSEYISVTKV